MKKVVVTIKFQFETEGFDKESLKEEIYSFLEEKIDQDDLLENTKMVITDVEDDDESYEDDDLF